jgi:steroid 5-alpha reductase family enzyme
MFLSLILAVMLFVHIFFLIALIRKNFAVIDVGWGLGILLACVIAYFYYPGAFKNKLLLTCVSVWAIRLAIYISLRNWGKGEDPRYTKFRKEWEPYPNLQAWIKVFVLQGGGMIIVSLPVSSAMVLQGEMNILNWLGLIVFLAGFTLEVVSDYYLNWWRGQQKNKGKICSTGPWMLCRFPNYFGEVFLWYGLFLIGVQWENIWSIIGSIVINFFILKVTGVPLLEGRYLKRSDYLEYARRVPRFIPFMKPKL